MMLRWWNGRLHKSEVICRDSATRDSILLALPGARVVDPMSATLLGSPIGDVSSVSRSLGDKLLQLSIMGRDFNTSLPMMLSYFFATSLPKLLYTLRT